jgi:hypothetical protein
MRTILSRGLASHQRTQRVLDKLCQVLHVFWQNGPTSFLAQQMRGTTGNRMGHTALHECRYTSVAAWLSKIRKFVELELAMSAIPQCGVIFLRGFVRLSPRQIAQQSMDGWPQKARFGKLPPRHGSWWAKNPAIRLPPGRHWMMGPRDLAVL